MVNSNSSVFSSIRFTTCSQNRNISRTSSSHPQASKPVKRHGAGSIGYGSGGQRVCRKGVASGGQNLSFGERP
eukprot:308770-Prorocentrum_minimum.AAC.2